MKSNSKLRLKFNPDGMIDIDARKMIGSVAEITAGLNDLARERGGDLAVEKHIHHGHEHTHEDDHDHEHA